ncbi:MAG: type II toxin-antitoxin system Phd/YefM family antitoxin [Pyrinomonadaceae bacterium]
MEKLKTISATTARANFFGLIDETAENHQPVRITTKRNNAILVSEEDWDGLHETMYLLSIPGMRESLLEGSATPDEEMVSHEDIMKILRGEK